MNYGYARVSTEDQNLDSQVKALKNGGAKIVYSEKATSRNWNRLEWQKLLETLKHGDTLTVWRLDRAVASVEQLEKLLQKLEAKSVTLHSLTEQLDTSTAMGRAMVQLIGVLNQLRLDVIQENTRNGLEGARARGVIFGRRPILKPDLEVEAVAMVKSGKSQADVARLLRVSAATISRIMTRHEKRENL